MILLYILSIVAIIFVLSIGFFVNISSKNTLSKYDNFSTNSEITGKELAEKLIKQNNLKNVNVVNLRAKHTNYYSAKYNVLKFNPEIANSTLIPSLAMCSYHATHAKNFQAHTISNLIKSILDNIFKFISAVFIPVFLICAILNNSSSTHAPMFVLMIFLILYFTSFVFEFALFLLNYRNLRNCLNDLKNTNLFRENELEILHKTLKALNKYYFFNYTSWTLKFLWFISPDFIFRKK